MPSIRRHSCAYALLAVVASLAYSVSCGAQCDAHATLNAYERRQFIEVAFSSRSEVYAQYLSQPGCGRSMLGALGKLGAQVDYADERSGYALVTISRPKLLDTLDIPGIAYAYAVNDRRLYDEDPAAKVPQRERKAEALPSITIPYPRVATVTENDGPYFAIDEIGLTELWKQHPEFDGRGVRVGVVDEGFDLLHPALQRAMDAQGNLVPKVADIGTLTTPDQDSSWVQLDSIVRTGSGRFDAAGRTWTAPADGTYRFGIFRQELILGPTGNSHTKKLTIAVGVLWNQRANRVWIDTDGDGNFKNQHALGDYAETHDVDWFGKKNGDLDDRIPFAVRIDSARNAVYIRIGGMHGAYIAGALAGNRLDGGLFDGSAPSAQLVDANMNRATLLAAVVQMLARPDVDVVNFSGGIGRGGYPPPDEGMEDFAQHVVERASNVYDKPFVAYSSAPGSIDVQDYAGAEMLKRNRGIGGPYKDTTNSEVPWLPNGMVNNVVSPTANLETESRYVPLDIIWGDGERRSFGAGRFIPTAPAGYTIGDNPSPAIVVVSGILADLISGARREHVRYTADRLRNAVFTGARLLDDVPVSQQGYGLVDAAKSWQQLVRMALADDPINPQLTSFTLSQPKDGAQIATLGFQAEASQSDRMMDGKIWITRHGGRPGGRQYTLSLRGNDGTFILLDSKVTFVREKPAVIRFYISVSPGWHLAFLELRDRAANVVMEDVPLSIRVADKPDTTAPGVDKYESTIAPLRSQHRYVDVGDDVQAVRYVMRIPYTGRDSVSTRSFPGFDYDATTQPPGEPVDPVHHIGPLETLESLVANDVPGLQEAFWENRGRPEYATKHDDPVPDTAIHAEFEVHKYGIAIASTGDGMLWLTNRLAALEGQVEFFKATVQSSEMTGQGTHAMAEEEETVPAGLAEWRLRISATTDADAYLLDCTGKDDCYVVTHTEITREGALLVAQAPTAGTWRIVVRIRGQRAVTNETYNLTEARLTLEPNGTQNATRSAGERWALTIPDNTEYAAFRIEGTKGIATEKQGLLIATTPLRENLP